MWSKSQPEDFSYGRRLFFQIGSSYISAMDTSTKFGLRIDFDLRMRVTLSNTKPEVVWSRCGRHLENVYDFITQPRVIWTKFVNLIQNSTQITAI